MKLQNITKLKILNKEISFGVGIRQARTVDIGKIMKQKEYHHLEMIGKLSILLVKNF